MSNEFNLKMNKGFLRGSLRILVISIYHATFSSSYELVYGFFMEHCFFE